MHPYIKFNNSHIDIQDILKQEDIAYLLQASNDIEWVQFLYYEPTINDLKILNDFFKHRPEIYLRGVEKNYLQYLCNVQKVWFSTFDYDMFGELNYLNKLTGINLGVLYKKLDITPLLNFKETLTELIFEKDIAKKSISIISQLKKLTSVCFLSSKFDSLDFLENLNLTSFRLYGSRIKNYESLNRFKNLKHFWLKTNTNWEDFSFIENLSQLESIELMYCSGIRTFPKCSHLNNLKRVAIFDCNNLEDITELKKLKECKISAYGSILKKTNQIIER